MLPTGQWGRRVNQSISQSINKSRHDAPKEVRQILRGNRETEAGSCTLPPGAGRWKRGAEKLGASWDRHGWRMEDPREVTPPQPLPQFLDLGSGAGWGGVGGGRALRGILPRPLPAPVPLHKGQQPWWGGRCPESLSPEPGLMGGGGRAQDHPDRHLGSALPGPGLAGN